MSFQVPEINDQDREVFEAIRSAENIALLSGFYQGKPARIIVAVSPDDGEYHIFPLAILLTEDMMQFLGESDNQPLEVIHE